MMVRALAWKEWREQRAVVLTGLLLSLALPPFILAGMSFMGRRLDAAGLALALPLVYAVLVWPLFAAAAGAGTVAAEVGNGTLGFLLSRPVSRARIWTVKIAVALTGAAVVAAGSLAIAMLFRALVGVPTTAVTKGSEAESAVLLMLAAVAVVFFSAAAFLSTLLERAMTAAAGGVATALVIVTLIGAIWTRLDLVPRLEPEWLTLEFLLAGLAVLPVGLYVFARGELLRGRGAWLAALLGTAAVVAVGAISMPIVWQATRLEAGAATLWYPELSPSRDAIVATASTADGGSAQVWWIPTDGSGPQRRAGRLTFGPAFAGAHGLVYLSQRGTLGMRSLHGTQLRWQDVDGSGDRVLAGDLPSFLADPELLWGRGALLPSPDGERVAVSLRNRILVAERERGLAWTIDLSGTALEGGTAVGWTRGGNALVLFRARWGDSPEAVLGLYDLEARSMREVFRTSERVYFPYRVRRAPNRRSLVLLATSSPEQSRLLEVDVESGEERTLVRSACLSGLGADEEGELLAYGICSGEPDAILHSEIHVRDRRTGEDRILGSVPGSVSNLLLSPAADRAVLRVSRPGSVQTTIVGGGRPMVTIDGDWSPIGWAGKDQIVLRGSAQPTVLVVASIDGTVVRSLMR